MITIELELSNATAKAMAAVFNIVVSGFPGRSQLLTDEYHQLLWYWLDQEARIAKGQIDHLTKIRAAIDAWFAAHPDRQQLDEGDYDDDALLADARAYLAQAYLPASQADLQTSLDNERRQLGQVRAAIATARAVDSDEAEDDDDD